MANTIIKDTLLQKEVMRFLGKKAVIKPFANTKFQGQLRQGGDTVRVEVFPEIVLDLSGTAGSSITQQDFVITTEDLLIDKVAQSNVGLRDIEKVQSNLNLHSQIGQKVAYALDQLADKTIAVAALDNHADNRLNEGAPASLTKSNIVDEIEELRKVLTEQNAFDDMALFLNAGAVMLLRLSDLYTGIDKGFPYRTGLVASDVAGFKVFQTNNLPTKQKLTMGTNPSGDDTITIHGVAFTFKASPSAAGDIDIGSDAAGSQANLVAAINGGAGAGTDYKEVSAANRKTLLNAGVNITDFSSDIAYIRANQSITNSETFTAAGNIFGTAGNVIFAMSKSAVNYVSQMDRIKVENQVDAFAVNILSELVYGKKVFATGAKMIATSEITN